MVRKSAKKLISLVLVFLFAVVTLALVGQSTSALDKERFGKYSNYRVYFYDQDANSCEPGTTIPGGGSNIPFSGGVEEWDGSCTPLSGTRADWIRKQLSGMQAAATSSGIPWELLAGQSIQESGGARAEACDYNPLGLKAKSGHASCSNGFAKFNSYQEAYQYYIDSIISIREVKNKYPNDPYSAISYIQYGGTYAYASCDSERYAQCVGHMGEPTPGYVNGVSSIMCGIQKWAKGEGIAISSVTWENYSSSGEVEEVDVEEEEQTSGNGAVYCDEDGEPSDENSEDEEYEEPEAGNLVDYIKKWAWPNYEKDKTERMPAYAEYIDTKATYKGGCNGVDCGAFVANIIKASGWDSSYPQCGTSCQSPWLASNWNKVSSNSLQLGDVGIKPGHVILYVGNISGFNSNTASASQCDRAPMAGADKNLSNYTWYRKR